MVARRGFGRRGGRDVLGRDAQAREQRLDRLVVALARALHRRRLPRHHLEDLRLEVEIDADLQTARDSCGRGASRELLDFRHEDEIEAWLAALRWFQIGAGRVLAVHQRGLADRHHRERVGIDRRGRRRRRACIAAGRGGSLDGNGGSVLGPAAAAAAPSSSVANRSRRPSATANPRRARPRPRRPRPATAGGRPRP